MRFIPKALRRLVQRVSGTQDVGGLPAHPKDGDYAAALKKFQQTSAQSAPSSNAPQFLDAMPAQRQGATQQDAKPDESPALAAYLQAAERGDVHAQSRLGALYATGQEGVPQ